MRLFLLVFVFSFIISSCTPPTPVYYQNEGRVFGTFYEIVYKSQEDYHAEIRELLTAFNRSLSTYDTSSIISRINRGEIGVKPDSFFVEVFNTAQEVSTVTNGAFDMTVAPLVNAWGFGFEKMDSVTSDTIDSLLQYVGMQYITIENGVVVKHKPGVMLDGSAIAKGYGVDVVGGFLRSKGVENYMVEIGGEVSTLGSNRHGNDWRIAIDRPIDDPLALQQDYFLIVHLSGQALATSGNYRNFYIKDGKKYAHTINPADGYPVEHNLLSATVVAPNCMLADAYATAFMVLGLDKSKILIEQIEGVEACFVYDSDESMVVEYSSGFHRFLR